MFLRSGIVSAAFALMVGTSLSAYADAGKSDITATKSKGIRAEFDIVHAKVVTEGSNLVFKQEVVGNVGKVIPQAKGKLASADVYSYVWPTSLDSGVVGFEKGQGILALVLTSHPDFDDTPLYDEDGDGNKANDGKKWHSHWVVLTKDEACGKDGMKVKDIPEGTKPKLPVTWPNLPIFIDSPGYDFSMEGSKTMVKVPLKELGFPESFNYDAVTSALRVNEQVHAPLLCIVNVWDVASGDLSLPGKSK